MNIEMYNIHMDLYSAAEGVLLEIGTICDIKNYLLQDNGLSI